MAMITIRLKDFQTSLFLVFRTRDALEMIKKGQVFQYSNHFKRCYKSSLTSFRKRLKSKIKQKDRHWKTSKRKWRLLYMSKRSTLPPSVYFEKWVEKVFVELPMLLYKKAIPNQMLMVWVLSICSSTHPLSNKIRMSRWWLQEAKESQFVEGVAENQLL